MRRPDPANVIEENHPWMSVFKAGKRLVSMHLDDLVETRQPGLEISRVHVVLRFDARKPVAQRLYLPAKYRYRDTALLQISRNRHHQQ
jgi:hypothetical protein